MVNVKKRRRGASRISSKHQITIPAEALRGAGLQAGRHRTLKLPDALVIATATTSGADQLITTDRKWPTAKTMKPTVVIEQI